MINQLLEDEPYWNELSGLVEKIYANKHEDLPWSTVYESAPDYLKFAIYKMSDNTGLKIEETCGPKEEVVNLITESLDWIREDLIRSGDPFSKDLKKEMNMQVFFESINLFIIANHKHT